MGKWYVISTRRGWEKKVEEVLAQKGLESFCPLVTVKRQWSDRIKWVGVPLFESYIFVKITDEQRQAVRMTPGVKNFVYTNGKPAFLKNREVETLKQILFGSKPIQLFRLPCAQSVPETVWKNHEVHHETLGTKLKKARIYIGEEGYEVWAAKTTFN